METQLEMKNGNGMSKKPERKAAHVVQPVERLTKKFGISATFGIDLGPELDDNDNPILDAFGKPVMKEREVTGFVEPGPETPQIDPHYVFPDEDTKMILLGLELRDRILLTGMTGTGKTSILEQIAARLNYNVIKINFDGAITRQDLIGEWVVKPGTQGSGSIMEFQYGILPHAFQMPGTIIILDEWDTISGECSFVLQRPLQKDDGKLLILENGGELIPLHPQNTIIATANTCGMGDDTGLHTQGTKVQNYAQLNRFSMTVKMQYLKAEDEVKMIQKRFPDLKSMECEVFVKAINLIREAYVSGQISAPLSSRDLINWVEKFVLLGDPMRAATYCFLNRMPAEDAETAYSTLQRNFKDS